MVNKQNYFSRQTCLKEIGLHGQKILDSASVLIIGMGGLGCPVAQYLGGAGIGKIGLVDFDTVEETNLHRQFLYHYTDIGELKTEVAAKKLTQQFPHSKFISIPLSLTNQLALDLFPQYDVILDCTDSLSTCYLINDACFLLNKSWIYGSVNGFAGQWAILNLPETKAQFRDLFPIPPAANEMVNCNVNGTIAVVPGFTGTMQATACIQFLLNHSISGCLNTYDAEENQIYSIQIVAKPHLNQPQTKESFLAFSYPTYCGESNEFEITAAELIDWVSAKNILIVDVRDEEELPVCTLKETVHIPLPLLEIANLPLTDANMVVTLCQTGKRSAQAQQILNKKYPDLKIYNLKGGMDNLMQYLNK